ncbi:unnamed protein product [Heterobilharzia americana]|nr:unnamed protein product [Heterobilharzia americana]
MQAYLPKYIRLGVSADTSTIIAFLIGFGFLNLCRKLSDAFEVKTGEKTRLPTITHDIADCGGLDHAANRKEREVGIRCLTDEKILGEDLDFSDDLCLMSHKLEDLQAKFNNLTEEARQGSEDRTSSGSREDGGDEDTQPATTTTSCNHHQREKLKGSSLIHLHLPKQHRFNCRRRHR